MEGFLDEQVTQALPKCTSSLRLAPNGLTMSNQEQDNTREGYKLQAGEGGLEGTERVQTCVNPR